MSNRGALTKNKYAVEYTSIKVWNWIYVRLMALCDSVRWNDLWSKTMRFRVRGVGLFLITFLFMTGILKHHYGYPSWDFRGSEQEIVAKRFDNDVSDRVKAEHYQRIKHFHEACANVRLFPNTAIPNGHAYKFFSEKYNFSYYKIPKAGCSVWTQIFGVLNSEENNTEKIFYKQRGYVHSALQRTVREKKQSGGPFVVPARDPYSRLFSGYMDKIFLSLFSMEESKILRSQRKNVHGGSGCIKNATFQEFLRTIVEDTERGQRINKHWAPITTLCNPCATNVLAIAKQETFSSDVEFILKKVGVPNDTLQVIHNALHEHRLEATIPSYIREVLNHRTCKTKSEVAKDLWYTFQVNGYLNENSDFPVAVIYNKNFTVTPENLTRLVFKAISENPLTPEQSRRQRRSALVNAYKTVDEETIRGLQKVYQRDFALFDYSTQPP